MSDTANQIIFKPPQIAEDAEHARPAVPRQEIFEESHGAWLDEQIERFERIGVWCDELRVW